MSLITIGQTVTAILVIILVLLQDRSSGVGGAFGGGGDGGGEFYQRRRGMERIFFIATIVLTALFALLSILNLIF
jgi:protein translocase SecG subunit